MSADTKTCPYCAEDIKAAAIKCKHCGSDLTEVAPGNSGTPAGRVLLIFGGVVLLVMCGIWAFGTVAGNVSGGGSPASRSSGFTCQYDSNESVQGYTGLSVAYEGDVTIVVTDPSGARILPDASQREGDVTGRIYEVDPGFYTVTANDADSSQSFSRKVGVTSGETVIVALSCR